MSRNKFYDDGRCTIVRGDDHALGEFLQLFDEELKDADTEDIVLDWDELFGYSINKTGITEGTPLEIAKKYIENINTVDAENLLENAS